MQTTNQTGMILFKDSIGDTLEAMLVERESKGLSTNTLLFYRREISYFKIWLDSKSIYFICDITPQALREYFIELGKRRNKGGVHASYRAIKALLLFYESEFEPENWKNPIHKVSVKPNNINPLRGITFDEIQKLLSVCNGRSRARDIAIFNVLASSGVRATELINLNVSDIDTVKGTIRVIGGKGDKNRFTFISKDARKALRKYLAKHPANIEPLFLNIHNERMTKSSLEYMLVKYSKLAGLSSIGLHDFRRYFALNCYRKGMEVLIISHLLGHTSVEITKRYLNITPDDLKRDYDKIDF